MDFQSAAAIGRRRRGGAVLAAMTAALALVVPLLVAAPAPAATIELWHAMNGELGRQLAQLAAAFNASQSEHRVVPEYKGNYTETVTAAIFAVRTKKHPAIVQVNEIATATMMAAKGAIYPAFELMRDQGIPFDQAAYLPAVSGYYSDLAGNLLSFPFNASTPILYYNKDQFRAAGLDENAPPKTWPEVEAAARKLRQANVPCGFTTHWPSWVNVENFSAWHNVPIATHANGLAGFGAELTIDNPVMVRHLEALAEWQKTKLYDYSGRASAAEPRFPAGECGMFIGSSASRADILAKSKFAVGYGMLPYWPDVAGAPQNSIIGGATLWVLRGRPQEEYAAVAKFFAYLSQPQVQASWHQSTGYLPITSAAYDLSKAQRFYERAPGAAIGIEQIMLHPPTDNSRGLRLGSFVLIRDVIEEEMEQALAGKKSAKAALGAAVARGNELLRQFERTTR